MNVKRRTKYYAATLIGLGLQVAVCFSAGRLYEREQHPEPCRDELAVDLAMAMGELFLNGKTTDEILDTLDEGINCIDRHDGGEYHPIGNRP